MQQVVELIDETLTTDNSKTKIKEKVNSWMKEFPLYE